MGRANVQQQLRFVEKREREREGMSAAPPTVFSWGWISSSSRRLLLRAPQNCLHERTCAKIERTEAAVPCQPTPHALEAVLMTILRISSLMFLLSAAVARPLKYAFYALLASIARVYVRRRTPSKQRYEFSARFPPHSSSVCIAYAAVMLRWMAGSCASVRPADEISLEAFRQD